MPARPPAELTAALVDDAARFAVVFNCLQPILRAEGPAFVMQLLKAKPIPWHRYTKKIPKFSYCSTTIEVGVPGTGYVPTDVSAPLLVLRLNDCMVGVDWFPANK